MSAIRITGMVARPGRHFCMPDGTALLEVVLTQGAGSVDVVGRLRVGQGHAAQYAAQRAARHIRPRMRVTVHAAGFEIDHRSGHLVLQGVDHIEHHTEAPAIAGAQPEREPA
jgi:hypothetical protein